MAPAKRSSQAQIVPLGSVVSINSHSIGKDYPYSEINYVDISSVESGSLSKTTTYNINEAPSRAKRLVSHGDTILSTVRPNRRSFLFIKHPDPCMVISTGFAVLRPSKQIDSRYLYYLVTNQAFTDYLTVNAKGAAYPAVDSDTIARAMVRVPPLPLQRKISSILSAYDDLIENNSRRIKILEEMAQSLYREWFVYFRFPGHEKVKMIKSSLGMIPEGWEAKTFGELFDIRYGKNLPTTKLSETGKYPVYGASNVIGYYDQFVCDKKVALVSCRGNGSGNVYRTREVAFVTNNSLIMLPKNEYSYWEYFYIESLLKNSNIMGVKSGSAQPQITIEGLSTVKAAVPPKLVVESFSNHGTPISELIDSYYKKNSILRKSRDFLLPKLISNEVDLESIELNLSEH